jgi:hypothetical protein
MAIYHLEVKVVSRGAGHSAVAASAYLSCSRLYNDYNGVQHDYTRKQGLVWRKCFCRNAPRRNGKIGKSSGTPWKKSKQPKAAGLPVSSSWRCPSS